MTVLDPQTKLKVVQVYKNVHSFTDPGYPLERCKLSRIQPVDSLKDLFLFAEQPLRVDDEITFADLSPLFMTVTPDKFYFLRAFSQASAPASAPPVSKNEGGYQPDAFDADAVWKAHKAFRL